MSETPLAREGNEFSGSKLCSIVGHENVWNTMPCEQYFQGFADSIGCYRMQMLYFYEATEIVTDNQQCSAIPVTEVGTHFSPLSHYDLMLHKGFLGWSVLMG